MAELKLDGKKYWVVSQDNTSDTAMARLLIFNKVVNNRADKFKRSELEQLVKDEFLDIDDKNLKHIVSGVISNLLFEDIIEYDSNNGTYTKIKKSDMVKVLIKDCLKQNKGREYSIDEITNYVKTNCKNEHGNVIYISRGNIAGGLKKLSDGSKGKPAEIDHVKTGLYKYKNK